jgi:uncharacterized protein YceH (UPF0502 family)
MGLSTKDLTMRETSIEAYRTIKDNGLLSKARFDAYETVFLHGPMTANEIGAFIQRTKGHIAFRHNYVARCGELRDMGVFQEVAERRCNVSGFQAIVWEVTDRLPQGLPKTVSKTAKLKARVKELEARVAELETELAKFKRPPTQGDMFRHLRLAGDGR